MRISRTAMLMLLTFILLGIGAFTYENKIESNKKQYKSEYTVLAYINGAALESKAGEATKSIKQMVESGSNGDINVILEVGGSDKWLYKGLNSKNNYRIFIKRGNICIIEKTLGPQDMSKAETLEAFLKWGIKNYPAKKYALMLWNYSDGKKTNVDQLIKALANTKSSTGKSFELIGFDKNSMGDVEIDKVLKPYSNFIVASQSNKDGWDYKVIMDYLKKYPRVDGKGLLGFLSKESN